MSQNLTEKDVCFKWNDKQGEQELCVRMSVCDMGQVVAMDEQTVWWSSLTGSVSLCSELTSKMSY